MKERFADWEPALPGLKKDYIDKGLIRFVFKDYPLHGEEAILVHQGAKCAQDQDKFWEFHDALFKNTDNLATELYTKIATDLQLNSEDFTTCVESHMTESLIQKNYIEGKWLGITATPYFFINDVTVSGARDYEYFKDVITQELQKKESTIE